EAVANDRLALAPDAYLATVTVAQQNADRHRVREALHQREVLAAPAPGTERNEQMRVQRGGLELQAVAVVEIAELIGVKRLHRALPRLQLLVEDAEHDRRRVELQMLADVLVGEARALEQCGRVDRAAGDDHSATLDLDAVTLV